jgi:hypothetical protein
MDSAPDYMNFVDKRFGCGMIKEKRKWGISHETIFPSGPSGLSHL